MEVLCLFCLLAFYTNPVVGVQSDSSRIYRITDKTSSEKVPLTVTTTQSSIFGLPSHILISVSSERPASVSSEKPTSVFSERPTSVSSERPASVSSERLKSISSYVSTSLNSAISLFNEMHSSSLSSSMHKGFDINTSVVISTEFITISSRSSLNTVSSASNQVLPTSVSMESNTEKSLLSNKHSSIDIGNTLSSEMHSMTISLSPLTSSVIDTIASFGNESSSQVSIIPRDVVDTSSFTMSLASNSDFTTTISSKIHISPTLYDLTGEMSTFSSTSLSTISENTVKIRPSESSDITSTFTSTASSSNYDPSFSPSTREVSPKPSSVSASSKTNSLVVTDKVMQSIFISSSYFSSNELEVSHLGMSSYTLGITSISDKHPSQADEVGSVTHTSINPSLTTASQNSDIAVTSHGKFSYLKDSLSVDSISSQSIIAYYPSKLSLKDASIVTLMSSKSYKGTSIYSNMQSGSVSTKNTTISVSITSKPSHSSSIRSSTSSRTSGTGFFEEISNTYPKLISFNTSDILLIPTSTAITTTSIVKSSSDNSRSIFNTIGTVLPENIFCKQNSDGDWSLQWPKTTVHDIATLPCPPRTNRNVTGYAQRKCLYNGFWGKVEVNKCYTEEYLIILEKANILDDLSDTTNETLVDLIRDSIKNITEQLSQVTVPVEKESILPNELKSVSHILEQIANIVKDTYIFASNKKSIRLSEAFENIADIVSNVLDENNKAAFTATNEVPVANQTTQSAAILRTTEGIANGVGRALTPSKPIITLSRPNFAIQGRRIFSTSGKTLFPDSTITTQFTRPGYIPKLSIPLSFIQTVMEDQEKSDEVKVVNFVMNNMEDYLPLMFEGEDGNEVEGEDVVPGTLVVSSQIGDIEVPSVPENFTDKVVIEFNVKDEVLNGPVPSGKRREYTCVFWNPDANKGTGGWSRSGVARLNFTETENGTQVTCETVHLTSFVVLVSLVDTKTFPTFNTLNYIGCGISLFFLIISIIFLITLKKKLIRKVHNFIHLNLCLALTFGLLVFLAGIETATSNQDACRLVTFLLHYFLLSVFTWSLCESIYIYNLVKVSGANERKWIFIYFALGWSLPTPVVVLAIAVRYHFYFIGEFSDSNSPLYEHIYACWLPNVYGMTWAFLGPVILIATVNTILLLISTLHFARRGCHKKFKNKEGRSPNKKSSTSSRTSGTGFFEEISNTYPKLISFNTSDILLIPTSTAITTTSIVKSSSDNSRSIFNTIGTVLPENIFCKQNSDGDWSLQWPKTTVHDIATLPCPPRTNRNVTGYAQRKCLYNGFWGKVEVNKCYTEEYLIILEKANILDDLSDTTNETLVDLIRDSIKNITEQLSQVTVPVEKESILPNELKSVSHILEQIANIVKDTYIFASNKKSIRLSEAFENIADIVSNVLDENNKAAFTATNEVPVANQTTQSAAILRTTEGIANGVGRALTPSKPIITLSRPNFAIQGRRIFSTSGKTLFPDSTITTQFTRPGYIPKLSIPLSFIQTVMEDQEKSDEVKVVNFVMNNMEDYLPLMFEGEDGNEVEGEDVVPGTLVVSSQIGDIEVPSVPENFTDKVVIEFNVKDEVLNGPVPSGKRREYTCVFWNPDANKGTGGWSRSGVARLNFTETENGTQVTCETVHLTSFVVLVSLVDTKTFPTFNTLNYIGCGISLFFLIISIIFLITLKKKLIRKVHNFIHLNLCLALTFGLLVFLAGIETATSNQDACRLVTFLLHYFLLSVFTWSLCESIYIYNLVKVSGANERKWIFIYFALGWSLPTPVVVLAIAVRYHFYFIGEFSDSNSPLYEHIYACWLPNVYGMTWAFLGPVILIATVNTILLLISTLHFARRGCHKKFKNKEGRSPNKKRLLLDRFVLLLLICFTWVIGLFAIAPGQAGQVFAVLFIVTNSLQSMYIFIFCVIQNGKIWKNVTGISCGTKDPNSSKSKRFHSISSSFISQQPNLYIITPNEDSAVNSTNQTGRMELLNTKIQDEHKNDESPIVDLASIENEKEDIGQHIQGITETVENVKSATHGQFPLKSTHLDDTATTLATATTFGIAITQDGDNGTLKFDFIKEYEWDRESCI